MGVVEAKLAAKEEAAPSSSPNSTEIVTGELASPKLEEKLMDGVGAPEITPPVDDAGPDQDPDSHKKGDEEAAEKGVWPPLPQRPCEPDCAFYMKTGACKFGLHCRFNHPSKRRRHRVKSKKQSEDHLQAVKEEKQTPSKRMEQEDYKAVEEEKQTPSKRMEQEDYKAKLKKQWKVVQATKEEHEESHSKMAVQTACKVDEKEKEIVHNFMQLECENVEEKQKGGLLNTVEQTEKKVEEKQTPPKRMEQEDNKAVEEKQNISKRMEQQNDKASKEKGKETTSEKVGPTKCKSYTMPGGHKFGKSCKFVHSQKKIEVSSLELNFLGLPIRPGKKECPYYMRTGNCKFSTNCKYHHPDPSAGKIGQDPLSGCQTSGPMQQIGFGAPPLPVTPIPTQGTFSGPTFVVASPSYSPGPNLHSQRFPSNSECNGYQVHIDEYPERPGQPECQRFMQNGVCKFGSACKFHHPKAHLPTKSIGTFIPSYPFK